MSSSDWNDKINIRENLSYYFRVAKPYWKLFLLILFIVSLMSILEVVQTLIYKYFVDNGAQFASSSITQDIFVQNLTLLSIFFIGVIIIQAIMRFFRVYFLNYLESNIMLNAKEDIFKHLVYLHHGFHAAHRTGSMISKITRISRAIESLTDFFVYQGTPLIFIVIISFFVIAFFDIISAIIVLLTAIVFLIVSVYLLFRQQSSSVAHNAAEDYEKGFISDVFTNIETIKHFGKERRITNLFHSIGSNTKEKLLAFWAHYNTIESVQNFILGMGLGILLFFSIGRLSTGELTIGALVFIYTNFFSINTQLYGFMWGLRRSYEGLSDMQAVVNYLDIKNEVNDSTNAKPLVVKNGEINFSSVNFNYNKKRKIINDFTLSIKPKEKVAFVGHSGAGKTTIVKLLYRLYDINSGEINIDGKNISKVTQESLRNELSIVPQECVLFNDTIYNNIIFSRPSATKKEFIKAIKIAQLYDFIQKLPDKEETIVGERGIKLSGGEKQRVSIARAVLANKKILILDEATSALDSETEKNIQSSLFKLMEGKTTIIIAHRLSTIMRADKIVVMKKGKIIQVGTHEELAEKVGVYNDLWKLQKSKEIRE